MGTNPTKSGLSSSRRKTGRVHDQCSNAAGQIIASQDALGNQTTFQHDANGNVISQTDIRGTSTSTYDARNRLTQLTDTSGRTHRFTYDPDGNPTTRQTLKTSASGDLATILRQQNTYDLAGRLTQAYTRNRDGETLSRLAYSYDDNNNPTSRFANSATQRYTYDALDRLTNVSYSDGSADTYTYDASGNRLTKDSQPYTYNALNQMLTAPGGRGFTYDPQGLRTCAGVAD